MSYSNAHHVVIAAALGRLSKPVPTLGAGLANLVRALVNDLEESKTAAGVLVWRLNAKMVSYW